ncbi:MAG TPA: hypothetical protein PLF11_00295 [Bacillota bacterium]|nr:hypothetical protein [Dermatophilaceae bacterium]HOI35798.1 hypothetical protein [Bacillota bacterium]
MSWYGVRAKEIVQVEVRLGEGAEVPGRTVCGITEQVAKAVTTAAEKVLIKFDGQPAWLCDGAAFEKGKTQKELDDVRARIKGQMVIRKVTVTVEVVE